MGSARAPPKPVTVPPPTQGGTCCTFTLHALLWYLISYNAGMWCIITRGKKKKSWIWAILGSLITGQGRHHGPGLESGETFLKYRVVLEKKSKTRKSASTDNSRVLTLKQHHEFKEADKTKQNKTKLPVNSSPSDGETPLTEALCYPAFCFQTLMNIT